MQALLAGVFGIEPNISWQTMVVEYTLSLLDAHLLSKDSKVVIFGIVKTSNCFKFNFHEATVFGVQSL